MLQLRSYGPSASLTDVGRRLEDDGGARNVPLAPGVRPGQVLLRAEVPPESAGTVLDALARGGVTRDVSVAISITTLPAAALPGAAAVLGVNVAILLLAGTTTLLVQRRLARIAE